MSYPQANGLVERSVQPAKQLLKTGPFLSFLEYRNTQIDGLSSPAQLLMSTRLRALLPATRDQLKPGVINPKVANKRRSLKQASQRYYYNKSAKQLKPLENGDQVYIQTKSKTWKPATVLKKENRSYTVSTNDGGQYRRNRRFLLKANKKSSQKSQIPSEIKSHATQWMLRKWPKSVQTEQEPTPASIAGPTLVAQTQDTDNPPFRTHSGGVVKPPLRLDL